MSLSEFLSFAYLLLLLTLFFGALLLSASRTIKFVRENRHDEWTAFPTPSEFIERELTPSDTFGNCQLCFRHLNDAVVLLRCDCIACEGCFRTHLALQDDCPLCRAVIFQPLPHRPRMRAFKQETMVEQVEGALWLAVGRFLLVKLLMPGPTPLVIYMDRLCQVFYINHITAALLVGWNIDQRTDRSQWVLGLMMAASTGGAPVWAACGVREAELLFVIELLDCALWLPLALLWVLGKVPTKKK